MTLRHAANRRLSAPRENSGFSISTIRHNSGERPAILQIVPALDTGGAERTTVDIAAALARDGFAPLVATEGGRMLDELEKAGGEWINLPADSKAPYTLLANVWRLRRIVRERNIRLLHARSRAPAWSALLAARMTDTPFVTTYHGIYNAKNGLKRFYNSVMARGDAVIANSQWTAAHIGAEYRFRPKRLTVIPRGVDLARFDAAKISLERVQALRERWGVKKDEIVVLLPGRLTRWKGQTVLIDALADLSRAGALGETRAVFAGDAQGRSGYEGELRQSIATRGLERHIAIAGHVDDMPAAYLAADIVVSASTDPEAFGRVAAEAGAMGRPVIATDHGGSREILLPERSGLLVAPGNATALAAALRRLLTAGPDVRTAMGEEARAHIAQNFTVNRMCADTLALYRDILAERT